MQLGSKLWGEDASIHQVDQQHGRGGHRVLPPSPPADSEPIQQIRPRNKKPKLEVYHKARMHLFDAWLNGLLASNTPPYAEQIDVLRAVHARCQFEAQEEAFDKIDQDMYIEAMIRSNIPDKMIRVLQSFCVNQSYRIRDKDGISSHRKRNAGLLFCIMTVNFEDKHQK